MALFCERVIDFYGNLKFSGILPSGINIMNPYQEDPKVFSVVRKFYRKYYSDNKTRHMILGINPGRFGAGATGLPFTDTIRLKEKCGLEIPGLKTRETSSVFIYEMIDRYGGPGKFYSDYFISAVSPLGFTRAGPRGKELNYNYYDSRELADAIIDFVVDSIERQLDFGIKRDVVFCLGTGKNYKFLADINRQYHFFNRIEPLEHPRFIMQYRLKKKEFYIMYYLEKLSISNS
ncbi:MAG: DUF4918 family protein [Bacteroidota bacterium]|nr:DUF4918 family protein [Bacteroidota bacterium]